MQDDSQASTSLWMATADYLLGMEGRSVVVLDDGVSGGGMTGRTTAHLTNAYDDRYLEIEKLHGGEGARLTAESHTAAIEKIRQIISTKQIDCDVFIRDLLTATCQKLNNNPYDPCHPGLSNHR